MLSQLETLATKIDGRYATDDELQFVMDYADSFSMRLVTYQAISTQEPTIVQRVYDRLQALDPTLLTMGNEDLSAKWKRDTIRTLRYTAIALLLNDPQALQERFLLWFQSIMKAFGAQKSCDATYTAMQEVIQQTLPPQQAALFCPILEITRQMLGVI